MVRTVTRLLLLAALLFSAVTFAESQRNNAVIEGSKAADLDACVAPTDFMRRAHFELIEHQRHITVHQGIRKTDNSLAGCVNCHVAKDVHGTFLPVDGANPVTGEQQFCAGCHEYSGVQLDCFSCHTNVPLKAGK